MGQLRAKVGETPSYSELEHAVFESTSNTGNDCGKFTIGMMDVDSNIRCLRPRLRQPGSACYFRQMIFWW